jgi:CyaY protein
MTDAQTPSGWPDVAYRQAANAVLERIEKLADQWLDADVLDIDSARTGGMLTLTLPNRSQLIVNLQPPLHELWLAARKGGFHFRFSGDDRWPDTRDGRAFFEVFQECLDDQAGTHIPM